MYLLRYTFLVALFFAAGVAKSQVGISLTQVNPNGDIGQFFGKAPGVSVYYTVKDKKWWGRGGITYCQLQSRIDTVPQYMVNLVGSTTTIIPGYLVNDKLTMIGIFVDYSYRVLKVQNFGWYVGGGIMVGKAHTAYVRDFETVLHEVANKDILMGGFKGSTMINYNINRHFDVYGEAGINLVQTKDHTRMTNYIFGLGFDYYIKANK